MRGQRPPALEYQVVCPNCRVSFPAGTKACMHCAGPTARGDALLYTPDEAAFELDEVEEAAPTGRGPIRVVLGLFWVLLALLGSLYRVCTG